MRLLGIHPANTGQVYRRAHPVCVHPHSQQPRHRHGQLPFLSDTVCRRWCHAQALAPRATKLHLERLAGGHVREVFSVGGTQGCALGGSRRPGGNQSPERRAAPVGKRMGVSSMFRAPEHLLVGVCGDWPCHLEAVARPGKRRCRVPVHSQRGGCCRGRRGWPRGLSGGPRVFGSHGIRECKGRGSAHLWG